MKALEESMGKTQLDRRGGTSHPILPRDQKECRRENFHVLYEISYPHLGSQKRRDLPSFGGTWLVPTRSYGTGVIEEAVA